MLQTKCLSKETLFDLVFLVLLAFLLGCMTLVYPFGRDQGEYAAIAYMMELGRHVYSDIFNVKPPLTHLTHLFALTCFGHSMMAIRILDLLWQTLTAVGIYLIGRKVFVNRGISLLAGALYVFWYFSGDAWCTAQTDGFLNLPMVFGVYYFIKDSTSKKYLFVSGILISLAALFKYPIALIAPLLAIDLLIKAPKKNLPLVACLGIGVLIPFVVVAMLLALEGSLQAFWEIQSSYIPLYNWGKGMAALYSGFHNFTMFLSVFPTMLIAAVLSTFALTKLLRGNFQPLHRVLLIWWLCAWFHLILQNKYYYYHGLPLLAPAALCSAWFLVTWKRWLIPFFLALYVLFAYPFRQAALVKVALHRIALQDHYAMFQYPTGYSLKDCIELADFVRAHTDNNDTIFIWGFAPTVYFLAQRGAASRFLYNYPLYGKLPWANSRDLLVAELEKVTPAVIAIAHGDAIPWVTGTTDDSAAAFQKFSEFSSFVATKYSPAGRIGAFDLFTHL